MITVYIPSKNYGAYLESAVESVLTQTYRDFEILIIDDGSTDETPRVLDIYRDAPGIRVFRTEGIGLPKVCNLALKEAKGESIIRLDGDDVLDENALLVLEHALQGDPQVAIAFSDYYLMDEHGHVFSHERREKLGGQNHLYDTPPNGACTLIRCEVLRELGGYREDLGAQDGFDIWTRIVPKYKAKNTNLPLFYYRQHGQNLTGDSYRILNARRAIKRDASSERISEFRPITAVIPCRSHYDFQPDVWAARINGQTLLERSIERCMRSKLFNHIVVACDNPEAETFLLKYSEPRLKFFLRESLDTVRSKTLVPSLEKIARIYDPEFKGIIALCYLQSPFVSTETMEESIYTLAFNQTDCSIGVEEVREPLFKRTSYGLQPVNRPEASVQSDFGVVFKESNCALATRTSNLRKGSLTGPSVVSFVVHNEESFFINSKRKLKIANILNETSEPRSYLDATI